MHEGVLTPQDIDAAMRRFKKALIERALGAELTHHLGYAPGAAKPDAATNHRNGTTAKTVLTDDGTIDLEVPRDREGTFAPVLLPKHERRFTGFDDKILALYARGMTVREIQAFLHEMYAVEVSADLISTITDAIVDEVTTWQARPLERVYAVVFFDALRVKIRDEGVVRSKAIYLALGVRTDGSRDILGLWIEQTEGAKFWMDVFTDLRARGCEDILIAVTDGLKGMPDALAAIFPQTTRCRRASFIWCGTASITRAGAIGRRWRAPSARSMRRPPPRPRPPRSTRGRPVLRLPTGHSTGALHDQRARKRPSPAAQDHQDPWPAAINPFAILFSDRFRRDT